MDEKTWKKLFIASGINVNAASEYANIFIKNKISLSLLSLLNDNYLKNMGITAVGDILRILTIKAKPVSKNEMQKKPAQTIELSKSSSSSSLYEKLPGCELPVPTKRIVTPEMEGKYIINNPKRVVKDTSNSECVKQAPKRRIIFKNDDDEDERRCVILSMDTMEQKVSILERLGKTKQRTEKTSNDITHLKSCLSDSTALSPRKRIKFDQVDNKTILKRFFRATLPRDDQTDVHLSEKIVDREQSKPDVFSRLGPNHEQALPYKGVFKLPNSKLLPDEDEEDTYSYNMTKKSHLTVTNTLSNHSWNHLTKERVISIVPSMTLRGFTQNANGPRNVMKRLGQRS